MKKENQVVSLECAQEMQKLGATQDGIYSYFQYDKWNILLRETKEIFAPNNECGCNKGNLICSTFTVAEMGEKLPSNYNTLKFSKGDLIIWCCSNLEFSFDLFYKYANREGDARAKMWILLRRKGLL